MQDNSHGTSSRHTNQGNSDSRESDHSKFEISRAFQFSDYEIRVAGTSESPLWVVADVCKVLGLTTPSKVADRIPENERGMSFIHTPSGVQEMLVVNEPGLYRLIFRSNKPEAEAFQRWVFHEVLPAIRKTGGYSVLTDRIASLEKQNNHILTLLEEAQPAAGYKLATPQTRFLHGRVLAAHRNGLCPACEQNVIVQDGVLTEYREIHVTPYKKLNGPTTMMPVCMPCWGQHCKGVLIQGSMLGRVEAFAVLVLDSDPQQTLPFAEEGDIDRL